MLSGRLPYAGKDLAELATQHNQSAPTDLAACAGRAARGGRPGPADDGPRAAAAAARAAQLVERLVSLEIGSFSQWAG